MPDIMSFIRNPDETHDDPNGYMMDLDEWSESRAQAIAKDQDIELTEAHLEILNYLRDYYREYGHTPNVRVLMKVLRRDISDEKATKKYLYGLFPRGPSRQGCEIAGLPIPNDCIDRS